MSYRAPASAPVRETEGYVGRRLLLYHSTSPEAAWNIAHSAMYRGTEGLFGPGIYFAETEEAARRKARSNGAMIQAYVSIGVSLICRRSMPQITYTLLRQYGCDSVIGRGFVYNPEFVVYNWDQVFVASITVHGKPIYTALWGVRNRCNFNQCYWYSYDHGGACLFPCANQHCAWRGHHHQGQCASR